jgi:ribosomal protein L6P/L9E
MSNKIKSIFRFKNMILNEKLPEYQFLNESDKELLCSINLPEKVFLKTSSLENSLQISVKDKKSKLDKKTKKKLGFFSNYLKDNLKLKKKLIVRRIFLIGTGFKAFNSKINCGSEIIFKIGLSHLVKVSIPKGMDFKIIKVNEIKFSSLDKELIGSFLNFVASMRFPDAYKGRGLLISNKPKVKLKKGKVKS